MNILNNEITEKEAIKFINLIKIYQSKDFNEIGNIIFTQKVNKNIIKGIDLLIQSSLNGHIEASFAVGFLYHEGKYIKKDILKSIHFYKEASSFNNQYAKNNLGIIYKNGFENIINFHQEPKPTNRSIY